MKNRIMIFFAFAGMLHVNAAQNAPETSLDTVPTNIKVEIIPKVDLHNRGALTFFLG